MKEKFEKQFGCTNVPKQVLEFYDKHDGIDLTINEIFSFEKIIEEYNGLFKEFLSSGINHDLDAQYIPIANDGMGGYYAFIGNKEDENIYYLDSEFPEDEPLEYTISMIIGDNVKLMTNFNVPEYEEF